MAVTINASTTSGLQITSDTSGVVQFQTSGSNTVGVNASGQLTSGSGVLALPTSGTVTIPNGTGTVAVSGLSSNLVLGTFVASTSGTAIDFTGIPSWARRVTLLMSGVSTSGASGYRIQVGTSSGVVTTGYTGAQGYTSSGAGTINLTNGFDIKVGGGTASTNVLHGRFMVELLTGNTWVMTMVGGMSDQTAAPFGGGTITLSGALDRVRFTTGNGTDTFDAGSINVMWE